MRGDSKIGDHVVGRAALGGELARDVREMQQHIAPQRRKFLKGADLEPGTGVQLDRAFPRGEEKEPMTTGLRAECLGDHLGSSAAEPSGGAGDGKRQAGATDGVINAYWPPAFSTPQRASSISMRFWSSVWIAP